MTLSDGMGQSFDVVLVPTKHMHKRSIYLSINIYMSGQSSFSELT